MNPCYNKGRQGTNELKNMAKALEMAVSRAFFLALLCIVAAFISVEPLADVVGGYSCQNRD